MKKRVFFIEHIIELLILIRAYFVDLIPLPIFTIAITMLFRVKYAAEGFTIVSLFLVLFFLIVITG